MTNKKGGSMKESERAAEFNALICEAQAISIEADALRVKDRYDDFMRLAKEVKKIADKFRKFGGMSNHP
jgi:hypothetical protein